MRLGVPLLCSGPLALCHKFALQSTESTNSDKVGLLPGQLVKTDALFDPASKRNKTVIYPCSQNLCQLPCPCFICIKKPRPSCSCSTDGAVCSNCVEQFSDHSKLHGCLPPNWKFCIQIVNIFPFFNFWFLNGINFLHKWHTERKSGREHVQVKAPQINRDSPGRYPNLNQMQLFKDNDTYYERKKKGLETGNFVMNVAMHFGWQLN